MRGVVTPLPLTRYFSYTYNFVCVHKAHGSNHEDERLLRRRRKVRYIRTLKLEAAEDAGTRQIPTTILHKSTFTAHTRPNKIPVSHYKRGGRRH